jgi:hypothetical protein
MITMATERLVDDYLRRLEAAGAHLARARLVELVAEIREHIEAALAEEDAGGEAAVRNVLERLGPPEEIVAAAEPQPARAAGRSRAGALELTALLALLVPFVGWLVGMVLVLFSQAWSRREKLVGVGLALLPIVLPLLAVAFEAESGTMEPVPGAPRPVGLQESGTDGGPTAFEWFLLAMLAGLPSALFLGWRLRREPSAA